MCPKKQHKTNVSKHHSKMIIDAEIMGMLCDHVGFFHLELEVPENVKPQSRKHKA